jgi:tetratricopeptide (TPR) repeat protein
MGQCIAQDLQHPEKYVQLYDLAYRYDYPKRWDMIDSLRRHYFANLETPKGYRFRIEVEELAAKQHHDEKAYLIAQLLKMDYWQRSSKVPYPAFERWYNHSIAEADRINFSDIKWAFAFLYSANLRLNYQQDVLSLYYLNRAIAYFKVAKMISPVKKGLFFSGVSRIFYQFDDFANAIQYGQEVEKYAIEPTEQFLTLDVIGTAYLKRQRYDSALVYFEKALQMFQAQFATDKGKQGWYGILMGKKAHVYKATGQSERAVNHYKIGIEDTYKHNLWDNTCGFAVSLADLYLTRRKVAEAAKLISVAKQTTQIQGNESDKFQLHQFLSNYYGLVGNMPLVIAHKDSTQYWAGIVEKRRGKNVQIQADLKLETERRQNAETTLNENIRRQKINRIIAIVIVLLLTAIAFVLILRYQLVLKIKEKELKIQQQEAEKKLLEEQEKAKQEQLIAQLKLEEFTNIIIAKNKQIELLQAENEKGNNTVSIQQLQNNTLLTEEQWINFKTLFDKVHAGYLQRLKEKIPGISPAEIRLMALAKLKLDTKEMASSLGVSTNAVRNVWFRLKKKIDLPEDATWNDLADQM